MPDDFLQTSVKNANHDSTYLILGLLVTSICNPGLVDPYIDESSLPCVSPSLLDPCPASDCKAAFEDVHPVTGLSSKRGSLRPHGVNKGETIIKHSIFVAVQPIPSTTCSQKHRMLLRKRFDKLHQCTSSDYKIFLFMWLFHKSNMHLCLLMHSLHG